MLAVYLVTALGVVTRRFALRNEIASRSDRPVRLTAMSITDRKGMTFASLGKRFDVHLRSTSDIVIGFSVVKCGDGIEILEGPQNGRGLRIILRASTTVLKRIGMAKRGVRASRARRVGLGSTELTPSTGDGTMRNVVRRRTNMDARGRLSSRCGIHNNTFSRGSMCVGGIRICHPCLIQDNRRRNLSVVGPCVMSGVKFSANKCTTGCKSGVDSTLSVACGALESGKGDPVMRKDITTDLLKTSTCVKLKAQGLS